MINGKEKTACQMGEHLTSGTVHKEMDSPFAHKPYHITTLFSRWNIFKGGAYNGN